MIRNLLFVLCFALMGYAQTLEEQTLLNEAKKRNITNIEQALAALKENGISEAQARTLAREKGISFDDFLRENFSSDAIATSSITTLDPDTSILVNPEESLSAVYETIDSLSFENEGSKESSYFGYSIFDKNPYLEKEYLLGNIDEGYLISPGDELRIIVFGNNSLELEAVVDRNGNINIPNYGVFFAAGNTFKTLRSRLKTYLGKYFSGLLTSPQNTFLDISLTQLTPTKVVVMGQVNAPGPQILTTQANPLAALYAAGGIKESGSLREVRIYRNNKRIKTVDLYDYIITGSLVKDISLTNNDVVFVPPRISTVQLSGEVKADGFFEVKEGENLADLISFSGGLPPSAARDRINVLRIDAADLDSSDKTLITVNHNALTESNKNFNLYDGDEVEVFPLISDRVANRVVIEGNVYSPGAYSLSQFKDLKSLITAAARGVKEDTYFEKVDVKGVILPSGKETFASYNLSDVLSGAIKVMLKERDEVYVYSDEQVSGVPLVFLSGYGINTQFDEIPDEDLENPNLSEIGVTGDDSVEKESEENTVDKDNRLATPWRENLSIYDLVFENTSFESITFRKNLFESRIDVKSYDYTAKKYVTTPYSFNDVARLKSTFVKPYDNVIIYEKTVLEQSSEEVSVYGYVNTPGTFSLEKNMYVEDAILLAGGFADPADQAVVYVNREERDPNTDISSIRYTVNIDTDYLNGQKGTPAEAFVLRAKDVVTIRKDVTFELLPRIKVEGEVLYPRPVIASSKRVSLRYLLEEVGGLTDNAYLKSSYVLRDGLVLAVDLSSLNKDNPVFYDGDTLIIAKNYGNVQTQGAIENPSVFNWEKGKRAKYYIENSGGKVRRIGGKASVLLSNGKTKSIGFLKNPVVHPDSKIVVNYKAAKEKQEGKFLNDATKVLGVVSGALTTILLIERL